MERDLLKCDVVLFMERDLLKCDVCKEDSRGGE